MRRKSVLTLIAICAAGIVSSLLLSKLLWPNRITIQNASGKELREVQVILRDRQGHVFVDKRLPHLGACDSIPIQHGQNDFHVKLRYTQTGESREYESEIDLWSGEKYILAVQPDGLVEGRYEYSGVK